LLRCSIPRHWIGSGDRPAAPNAMRVSRRICAAWYLARQLADH
jgi:hypothetical protein